MENEYVILVDTLDNPVGIMEKLEAHQKGLLHRAFSIIIFNGKGDILLQKRALTKYHSPGLWTNACCSHPRAGEELESAAHRRLFEELGFDCDLKYKYSFIYNVTLQNGLTEHELDHVFVGKYEKGFRLNNDEVSEVAYFSENEIETMIRSDKGQFTEWFLIIWAKIKSQLTCFLD